MTPEEQEYADLLSIIGPKKVETEEMSITAHDPMVIQKLLERRKTKPVTLDQFPVTEVSRCGAEKTCPRGRTSSQQDGWSDSC